MTARNDKARGQAGQGAQQGQRNAKNTTGVANVNALAGVVGVEHFAASPKKPRGLGRATVELRDAILDALRCDKGPWTVRQVFYQVEVRGACEKSDAGYGRVQRQVLAMRREGLIPYGLIADNTRWMRKPRTFASLADWVDYSTDALRIDLWRDSGRRVEVWCEKDALAGVLFDVTAKWHVPLMVTKGYSSETFAYSAAEEIVDQCKPTTIYYLGDFDPSGKHAAHDLELRLRGFIVDMFGQRLASHPRLASLAAGILDFVPLAVTPNQIEDMDLPTRPTKRTDARLWWFVERYGDVDSCELDAIPPAALRAMVAAAIRSHLDEDALAKIDAEQVAARELVERTLEPLRAAA